MDSIQGHKNANRWVMSPLGESTQMPLPSQTWTFSKNIVDYESDNFGVYELLNESEVLYIGQGEVKKRLMAHFPDGSDPIVGATKYRVEYTGGKEKAEQRERAELDSYLKQNGKYPRFNQRRG